jgi:hypothetical protein
MGRIAIGKNARGLRMGNVQGRGRVRIGNIYGDDGMGEVDIASGAIDAEIGNVDGDGEAEIGNIYKAQIRHPVGAAITRAGTRRLV